MPGKSKVLGLVALASLTVGLGTAVADTGGSVKSSGHKSASTASGSTGMAAANRIVKAAETSAAYGPSSGSLSPSQISAANASSINPVKYSRADGKGKSAIAIACASTSIVCMRQAQVEAAALKAVGWKATAVAAGNDYSTQSYQQAMTNALAKKPTAIITNGLQGEAIGPQLAAARKAGIFTVANNVDKAAGGGYGAYNPSGYSLATAVEASFMAHTAGAHAKIFWTNIPEFSFLDVPQGVQFGKTICPTCSWTMGQSTAATLSDPVAFGQYISSLIQANPGTQFFAEPGESPYTAGQQAIAQSNNPGAKQLSSALAADTVADLKQGAMAAAIGVPSAWTALVSDDIVLNHDRGKRTPSPTALGMGVMIMTKNQVPKTISEASIDKWAVARYNFVAPYSKAWGVNLNKALGL